ncbi:MAG: Lysyl-tRNA synthetase [Candidatus Nomurabacteria bacterium GW2011_GWF2_40_12]|uniref:ATP-dependent zinc metalloprotease FtsH n=1 Tax=Candidatus Nomurabacteria bacterium GW2011_GWF2_40_12 TaxID=1618776 RepID=A0A0G0QPH9_9BACT|nr:MAG: Lysyl-tRNA synthetase [Candidatus Nomurabacteria bacterium GW2011_GWF2_40_12]
MDFNFLNQKEPQGKGKKNNKPAKWGGSVTGAILFFIFITGLYLLVSGDGKVIPEVAISDLAKSVQSGEVKNILVEGDKLTITYENDEIKTTKKEVGSALSQTLFNYGVTSEALNKTKIEIKNESGFVFWLTNILPFLLPIAFILVFFWYLSRQVKGAGMQAFTFGQSKARITDPNDKNNRVTFKDVAGCKEAKEELKEIVDFLKSPKKFLDIGARIPKGVMLTGAPGTGKTLLARAVAGEASVPFFHLSGSEFVEMFVGVGASRVRDLFKMAKKAAPAIIFVDEIDAIGRTRGGGFGGGNDEREQTLNQILVEMDGFEPNDKVIVMAATNRPDVLDPALVRPGRFDRKVILDLPDRADREEILKIHAVKKPLAEDINLKLIAERTPGFSGADLYSLMNEGAILAARENRKKVFQFDLIRAIEKVMLGPERKSHLLSKKEKEITAYHEAGHAIVASVLPHADPVHKVSIIARGNAGGYTLKLPLEERRLQSKKEFIDDIAMSLGGYVAEKMIFGDITTGPSSDLQVASNLARAMVTRWGMSDLIGPIALTDSPGRLQYGEMPEKEFSETVSTKVDSEVSRIINDGLQSAEKVLTEHKKAFTAIAKKLIEVETLEQEDYEKILTAHGIELKKKDVVAPAEVVV